MFNIECYTITLLSPCSYLAERNPTVEFGIELCLVGSSSTSLMRDGLNLQVILYLVTCTVGKL